MLKVLLPVIGVTLCILSVIATTRNYYEGLSFGIDFIFAGDKLYESEFYKNQYLTTSTILSFFSGICLIMSGRLFPLKNEDSIQTDNK